MCCGSAPLDVRRTLVRGCASADRLGTLVLLPRRHVQPLCVKPLVERPVVGGEPGQLGGVLDGVRVNALAPLEAGAGADVQVPACGPALLRPFTGLPGERPWDEGQPDGRAVGRHRRLGSCHEVIGVDDNRSVPPGFADSGLDASPVGHGPGIGVQARVRRAASAAAAGAVDHLQSAWPSGPGAAGGARPGRRPWCCRPAADRDGRLDPAVGSVRTVPGSGGDR